MPRPTTLIALLQTLLIIIGFFALGIVMKVSGYPKDVTLHWNPLAVFLREHGLWLLALPVVWVFYATTAQRLEQAFCSSKLAFVIGLYIAGIPLILFIYAAIFPYTRGILIHQP